MNAVHRGARHVFPHALDVRWVLVHPVRDAHGALRSPRGDIKGVDVRDRRQDGDVVLLLARSEALLAMRRSQTK